MSTNDYARPVTVEINGCHARVLTREWWLQDIGHHGHDVQRWAAVLGRKDQADMHIPCDTREEAVAILDSVREQYDAQDAPAGDKSGTSGEQVAASEGQAWPGPWRGLFNREGRIEWFREWTTYMPAVDLLGDIRTSPPCITEIGAVGTIRTAADMRRANAILATVCEGEDPHPIPAELLGEEQA